MALISTPVHEPQVYSANSRIPVAGVLTDTISETLFNDAPALHRVAFERRLLHRLRGYLEAVQDQMLNGMLSEGQVQLRLSKLDQWLNGRLSGRNLLALVRDAETRFPSLIELMPRVLSQRYEEVRVARIWASLLNANALKHLRSAIAAEREIADPDFMEL